MASVKPLVLANGRPAQLQAGDTLNMPTLAVTQGGTGTATQFGLGSVLFAGPAGVYTQDNAHFQWDTTYQFLTITGTGFTLNLQTGAIYLRDNAAVGVEMHVRPGQGKAGAFTFTENNVADRWVVGIKPGDGALYFQSGNIAAATDRVLIGATGNVELVGGDLVMSDATSVQKRTQVTLVGSWVVGTDATRIGRLVCNVWDTAAREVWRGEVNGTVAMIGFLGAAAVVRQVSGAALTNNVTAGGTTDTIANYTSLSTYSTDAAAIRNNLYQLARKVAQINDALRLYGLLT